MSSSSSVLGERKYVCVNYLYPLHFISHYHLPPVKPFVKATNMNTYLHFASHHPRHLKMNIPYGQFLRIKRNATNASDFHSFSQKMQQFLRQGYPKGIVDSSTSRAATRDPVDLFKDREHDERTQLHAAFDYTPHTKSVIGILRKHWHLVADIPRCEIFPSISFKRT